MSNLLIRDKDLLTSIASIGALISLFCVYLAARENRKQNILRTAPVIAIGKKNGKIGVFNLNNRFAYNLHSERFYWTIIPDESGFNWMTPGRYLVKIELVAKNYIEPREDFHPLRIYLNNEISKDDFMEHLYLNRLMAGKTGIVFFFKDAQNHRFITQMKSVEREGLHNRDKDIQVLLAPRYLPWYSIFWIWFWARSAGTYRLLWSSQFRRWYKKIKEDFNNKPVAKQRSK